nr:class I SAM-dependent methyltransferase [Alteraurantiacibacter buctensis]
MRFAQRIEAGVDHFWQRFGGMPDVAGKRVLDFGCSRGAMIERLMRAGARSAIGFDLNRGTTDFARRKVASRWPGQVEIVCGDICELAFAQVDLVVSSDTMEHVMDVDAALRSVVAACRPGGELFIGFGPLWHSPFGHHRMIAARLPWAHLARENRAFLEQFQTGDGRTVATIGQLGFNGATPADFRRALAPLPVEVISARRNQSHPWLRSAVMKAMLVPASIPPLEKYLVSSIYWHLRKRAH